MWLLLTELPLVAVVLNVFAIRRLYFTIYCEPSRSFRLESKNSRTTVINISSSTTETAIETNALLHTWKWPANSHVAMTHLRAFNRLYKYRKEEWEIFTHQSIPMQLTTKFCNQPQVSYVRLCCSLIKTHLVVLSISISPRSRFLSPPNTITHPICDVWC